MCKTPDSTILTAHISLKLFIEYKIPLSLNYNTMLYYIHDLFKCKFANDYH